MPGLRAVGQIAYATIYSQMAVDRPDTDTDTPRVNLQLQRLSHDGHWLTAPTQPRDAAIGLAMLRNMSGQRLIRFGRNGGVVVVEVNL